MQAHVEGFRGPIDVQQFSGGQSNPTFLVQSADHRYVLRRKPPGKLLPSAHAVDREYRGIVALANTAAALAQPLRPCADPAGAGTTLALGGHSGGRPVLGCAPAQAPPTEP